MAKNMTKERVDIHIDQQHLRVVIRDAEGQQEYELDVELYGQVSCINFSSPFPVSLALPSSSPTPSMIHRRTPPLKSCSLQQCKKFTLEMS